MEFEFDPEQSVANRRKHGIDFVAAQRLWEDENAVGFPARADDEARFPLLAQLEGRVWVALCARSEDRIRLISVRRARPQERVLYES